MSGFGGFLKFWLLKTEKCSLLITSKRSKIAVFEVSVVFERSIFISTYPKHWISDIICFFYNLNSEHGGWEFKSFVWEIQWNTKNQMSKIQNMNISSFGFQYDLNVWNSNEEALNWFIARVCVQISNLAFGNQTAVQNLIV